MTIYLVIKRHNHVTDFSGVQMNEVVICGVVDACFVSPESRVDARRQIDHVDRAWVWGGNGSRRQQIRQFPLNRQIIDASILEVAEVFHLRGASQSAYLAFPELLN